MNRSVLVRDALCRVVDQDELEAAARRERFEAFRRGMEADEERLRAMLSRNDQGGGSEPGCLNGLATGESATLRQALAAELAAPRSQTPAAS